MPHGDKTGPRGQGPMTGRGARFCSVSTVPGSMNPGSGRGMGRGGCGGRGWRNLFHATGPQCWQPASEASAAVPPVVFTPTVDQQQITALEDQTESLQKTLNEMQKRIEELEAKRKPE